jgi:Protein of unknown function (DUF3489)
MTKPTSKHARSKPIDPKSSSTKLTSIQLDVLSRARQRDDGAVTVPEGMKDKDAHRLATTLVERGLVRELRAKPGMPVWRKSEEEGSLSLILTKLGHATIKVGEGDVTTGAGAASAASPGKQAASTARASKAATPRHGSKLAEVIVLLTRKGGASIEELTSMTGWLPHTTRAALTGLRKRGYGVERQRTASDEASIYRIVDRPAHSRAA